MVKCEVETVTSTIETFGKYTQICTNIVFNKGGIKTIENNKRLKRSVKRILHKYERSEIVNCIYCGSSINSKRIAILTERVCNDEEAHLALEDQKKVVNSIVRLLKAAVKRMNSNEARRSITRVFKNDRRVQVYTRFVLSTREYYEVKEQYEEINNFILELTSDYKHEKNENLMFKWKWIYEAPFGCEISLVSFIDVKSYNKRLVIVNKHKRVIKLVEKLCQKWRIS